jgi:hypothetical protein
LGIHDHRLPVYLALFQYKLSYFLVSHGLANEEAPVQESATMDHDVHRFGPNGSAFSDPPWQKPSGLVDGGGGGRLLFNTDSGRHLAV